MALDGRLDLAILVVWLGGSTILLSSFVVVIVGGVVVVAVALVALVVRLTGLKNDLVLGLVSDLVKISLAGIGLATQLLKLG